MTVYLLYSDRQPTTCILVDKIIKIKCQVQNSVQTEIFKSAITNIYYHVYKELIDIITYTKNLST